MGRVTKSTKPVWRIARATSFALAFSLACGPELDMSHLEEDSDRFCQLLVDCYDLDIRESEERWQRRCAWDFTFDGDLFLKQGVPCANAYADLTYCRSEMSCEEYDELLRNKPEEHQCYMEEAEFEALCMRVK